MHILETIYDIDGLVQERHNSSVMALELCLSIDVSYEVITSDMNSTALILLQ